MLRPLLACFRGRSRPRRRLDRGRGAAHRLHSAPQTLGPGLQVSGAIVAADAAGGQPAAVALRRWLRARVGGARARRRQPRLTAAGGQRSARCARRPGRRDRPRRARRRVGGAREPQQRRLRGALRGGRAGPVVLGRADAGGRRLEHRRDAADGRAARRDRRGDLPRHAPAAHGRRAALRAPRAARIVRHRALAGPRRRQSADPGLAGRRSAAGVGAGSADATGARDRLGRSAARPFPGRPPPSRAAFARSRSLRPPTARPG